MIAAYSVHLFGLFLLTSRKVGRDFLFRFPSLRSFISAVIDFVCKGLASNMHARTYRGACNHPEEPFLRHTVAERTKPDFCMGGGAGNDKSIRSLLLARPPPFLAIYRLGSLFRGLQTLSLYTGPGRGLRLLVPKILRPASETWQTGSNLRDLQHRPLIRSRIPLFSL